MNFCLSYASLSPVHPQIRVLLPDWCLLSRQVTRQQMRPSMTRPRLRACVNAIFGATYKAFLQIKACSHRDTSSFLGVAVRVIDGHEASPVFCLIIVRATAGNICPARSPCTVHILRFLFFFWLGHSAQGPRNVIRGVWLFFCMCVCSCDTPGTLRPNGQNCWRGKQTTSLCRHSPLRPSCLKCFSIWGTEFFSKEF